MANSLVDPAELADFPGAPFADALVDAAVAEIRDVAGWHIAPPETETFLVDGTLQQVLVLPTLKIGTITEVRDVTGDTPEVVDATTYEVRRNSMLYREVGWPCRLQSIEVDLTHGFADIPDNLLPVVAELGDALERDSSVSQISVGSYSESYRSSSSSDERVRSALTLGSWLTLARYKVWL